MNLFVIPITAFLCSVILHLVALKIFPAINLLDFPEKYGEKRAAVPYPTGIISVITFLLFLAIMQEWSTQTMGLIIGIAMIAAASFIDDRTHLPPTLRLSIQVLAALLIFATGTRIYTLTNPLETITGLELIKLDTIDIQTNFFGPLPLWSGIFTIIWLGLTINALNWFDGIPGQVSLLSIIGFLTIGFLSLNRFVDHFDPELQQQLALISFTLAGLSFASLTFDFPPNKVLMGDTGAMFFGLMLGVLTIYAGGKVATAFLVLGVPLIDSGIVVLRRLAKGASPLRGSASGEHLHHRLLAKGWSKQQVIGLTAILGSAFGISALFLSTTQKFAAALVLLGVMIWLSIYSRTKS